MKCSRTQVKGGLSCHADLIAPWYMVHGSQSGLLITSTHCEAGIHARDIEGVANHALLNFNYYIELRSLHAYNHILLAMPVLYMHLFNYRNKYNNQVQAGVSEADFVVVLVIV